MTPAYKYALLSCVSGAVWGCIVALMAFSAIPYAIWGGLIAGPAIGLLIGLATRPWCRLPTALRIPATLLSLYLAAALFGLGVGVYDWLAVDIPYRIPSAVVLQAVLAFLWGLTFTGAVLVLWPLAYLNHWLLARMCRQSETHLARAMDS